jgi:hypothetical protein
VEWVRLKIADENISQIPVAPNPRLDPVEPYSDMGAWLTASAVVDGCCPAVFGSR